jgi:hypothetical protein
VRARAASAVIAVAVAGLVLAACAPDPGPTPTITTTVTATVTATPTATPTAAPSPTPTPTAGASPNDPITALGAWSICAGIAVSYFPPSDWTPGKYTPDAVKKESGGTFHVTVGYNPKGKGSGAAIDCEIGGTVGAPDVLVSGPYDFG